MQSDTLRLFRMAKNLKQQIIADLLGMSQANYSNLENGKTKINSDAAKKLATYYGVSESVFLNENPRLTNVPTDDRPIYIENPDHQIETNESLLDPVLARMELLLNLLADEKEELAHERRQLTEVFDKLAHKFDIHL